MYFAFYIGQGGKKLTLKLETAVDERKQYYQSRAYHKMLPETKELLDKFYAPYNRRLADMLCDRRFLFT